MKLEQLLLFAPACFALNMAFGPNNLLSVTNATRQGMRDAVLAASGRLCAFAPMIAIAGLGLGTLLATSQWVFFAVKWLGAAYLVWLGIKLLRAKSPAAVDVAGPREKQPLARLVRQEFWVAAGNPKAILIFMAFFPQFVDPADYAFSFFQLGLIFLLLEVVAVMVYAMLGKHLGGWLSQGSALRWFNRVSGGMMVGFGAALALMRKPLP